MTLSRERCRGTLQSHNSEEGSKKFAKTEPKQVWYSKTPYHVNAPLDYVTAFPVQADICKLC